MSHGHCGTLEAVILLHHPTMFSLSSNYDESRTREGHFRTRIADKPTKSGTDTFRLSDRDEHGHGFCWDSMTYSVLWRAYLSKSAGWADDV